MINLFLWMFLFIVGYTVIFFSADLFIDNIKELCLIYNFSPFILGLIILGVDLEETIASVVAAINGLPYIAVGNVIGNSIIALTICFALPAFIYEIKFKRVSQFYFLIINICMIMILMSFFIYFGLLFFGIIGIGLYFFYVIRSIRLIKKEGEIDIFTAKDFEQNLDDKEPMNNKYRNMKIFLLVLAFIFIFLGAELLIFSTKNLIEITGISEAFFGFVIIALVTNVEEFTIVFKSIKKKTVEIGLGGMIGKIMWNLSLTFGLSGIILMNIAFDWILIWNWLLLLITLVVFNFITIKKKITRKDGLVLLILFIIFIFVNFFYI